MIAQIPCPLLVTDHFYSGLREFLLQPLFFVYSDANLETPKSITT